MLPFFATIGAAAGSLDALPAIGWTFALITIQLTVSEARRSTGCSQQHASGQGLRCLRSLQVHVAVSVIGGRMLRLPMEAIPDRQQCQCGRGWHC